METVWKNLTEEIVSARAHGLDVNHIHTDWKVQYDNIRIILLQNGYTTSALDKSRLTLAIWLLFNQIDPKPAISDIEEALENEVETSEVSCLELVTLAERNLKVVRSCYEAFQYTRRRMNI